MGAGIEERIREGLDLSCVYFVGALILSAKIVLGKVKY